MIQITRNVFTIGDLNQWYTEKSLVVNKDYQREGGIWADNARTFLIDTILNGYPFPKITLRQIIDLKTRKAKREIVDGQQRMLAIHAFCSGDIRLTKASENYQGRLFSDLDDESKMKFLGYEVSVDTIVSGSDEQVLEVFRRMNSYTLPLNPAEQRHAEFQGEFKWMINNLVESYSSMLISYHTVNRKGALRMADADLLTELAQVLLVGIVNREPKALRKLYSDHDTNFPKRQEIHRRVADTLDFIRDHMPAVGDSGLLVSHQFYCLFAALVFNKFGNVPNSIFERSGLNSESSFAKHPDQAQVKVLELLSAYDRDDRNGQYKDFVEASSATTHRVKQREIKALWFLRALQGLV